MALVLSDTVDCSCLLTGRPPWLPPATVASRWRWHQLQPSFSYATEPARIARGWDAVFRHAARRLDKTPAYRHTRPCYDAKLSSQLVDLPITLGHVHHINHVPSRPINFTMTTTTPHHNHVEPTYWSWLLDSDTTVRADYTLMPTTTGPIHNYIYPHDYYRCWHLHETSMHLYI